MLLSESRDVNLATVVDATVHYESGSVHDTWASDDGSKKGKPGDEGTFLAGALQRMPAVGQGLRLQPGREIRGGSSSLSIAPTMRISWRTVCLPIAVV